MLLCPALRAFSGIIRGQSPCLHTASLLKAARKGTRAKREAKKKAAKARKQAEEVKKVYIPHKLRAKLREGAKLSPRIFDDHKRDPVDDVYITMFYRWQTFSVSEALNFHRETHHRTQYNDPSAAVHASIELSLRLDKKNRYLERLGNIVKLPHDMPMLAPPSILVITNDLEAQEKAKEMGAQDAVGTGIVKKVQTGEFSLLDYKYVLSEVQILPDIIALKGILKRKFPSIKDGTAALSVLSLIEKFYKGIEYQTVADKFDVDFGHIEVPIGTLEMTNEQLEDNLRMLIVDIDSKFPPNKSTDLITSVKLKCEPTTEQFKIDPYVFIGKRDDITPLDLTK